MKDYRLFQAMAHEADVLQFYLADIMIDVSIITEAEPDTRFVWMVRDMGTHLAVIGKENCDEYVDAVRNSWGNVRMYLIHKRKLTGDGQTYTIQRLTEKSIRPVQIKRQDKIDMLKALALYARNSIDCIRANKELMNTDTKEYLQELDKTMQELPIRDSKKCTIA
nr:MAG TPA_asm: hypothetical protein [Caudoviricetes sp.]